MIGVARALVTCPVWCDIDVSGGGGFSCDSALGAGCGSPVSGASRGRPMELEAENAALRDQLIVLQRRVSGRVQLTNGDRLFLVMLYRWFPSILKAITIIRSETLVRWHRAGFRRYWRWKSRSLVGRPQVD